MTDLNSSEELVHQCLVLRSDERRIVLPLDKRATRNSHLMETLRLSQEFNQSSGVPLRSAIDEHPTGRRQYLFNSAYPALTTGTLIASEALITNGGPSHFDVTMRMSASARSEATSRI